MLLFLLILNIMCAMLICYQDIRSRWIQLGIIIAFGVSLLTTSLMQSRHSLPAVASSLLFLGVLLGILYMYLFLKKGRRERLLNRYMGAGDILILAALCTGYNLYNYVLIVLCGCLVALAYWGAVALSGKKIIRIPLAGCLMFTHTIFVVICYATGNSLITTPVFQMLHH